MSAAALITMLVVCTFVWGGFLVLLVRALRREARKTKGERGRPGGGRSGGRRGPPAAKGDAMRIYLTGFMGVGKSTVGRSLAEALKWPMVDLDEEIEARAGMAVRGIFESGGEAGFRDQETRALRATLDEPRAVIATGGGALTVEGNLELMRSGGVVVWLNLPFEQILRRIGGQMDGDRPLFRNRAQALELFRTRLAAYRLADLRLDLEPDETPQEVAARIRLLLEERDCVT